MTHPSRSRAFMVALALAALVPPLVAAPPPGPRCSRIEAHLVEAQTTTGCKPGHATCFLGEAKGTHGFRADTYFRGDARGEPAPPTPFFIPYSGDFEYKTPRGTLIMKEAGLSNTSQELPEQGAVLAFQKVVEATGDLAGSTGYFFVSGFRRDGRVVTRVFGEICTP